MAVDGMFVVEHHIIHGFLNFKALSCTLPGPQLWKTHYSSKSVAPCDDKQTAAHDTIPDTFTHHSNSFLIPRQTSRNLVVSHIPVVPPTPKPLLTTDAYRARSLSTPLY